MIDASGKKVGDPSLEGDLLKALAEINDPAHRSVLALLLRAVKDIGTKLDAVLSDEARIREIVLDGFSKDHHDHHVWLEGQIKRHKVIAAVNAEHDESGLCSVARGLLEEREANKTSGRRIRDDLLKNAIWAVIVFFFGGLASLAIFK